MTFANTTYCRLENYGLIKISGPDAAKFLQGQLTCNINQISETYSTLGAYANIQGRLLCTFRVYQIADHYYLRMVKDALAPCLQQLKKYAVFSKIEISIDDEHVIFGVSGDDSIKLAKTIFSEVPEKINQQCFLGDACLINLNQNTLRIEALISKTISDTIEKQLAEKISKVDDGIWRLLDIQAGIANIYNDTKEKLLAHDVNFHESGGISFDKGCYLGQEIIARMHYRGTLKKRMLQVSFSSDTPFVIGTTIMDQQNQKAIGTLVDAVAIDDQKHIGLMILPLEIEHEFIAFIDGKQLHINL